MYFHSSAIFGVALMLFIYGLRVNSFLKVLKTEMLYTSRYQISPLRVSSIDLRLMLGECKLANLLESIWF